MLACSNSGWSFSALSLLTLGVGVGVFALAQWVRRQPLFPGRYSFMLLHLACLWWLGAAALEMIFHAPGCKIFWASMAWPGILAVPTFWAVFLWQYVSSSHLPLARRHILQLTTVPVLFWLVALTNPWHGLLYGQASAPLSSDPGAPLNYDHGPLFYIAVAYGYAFMTFCMAIAVWAAILSKGLLRRHYIAFAVLSTIPWIANVGYVAFDWALLGFDPTSISFALTVAGFGWLIVGLKLFDLLPVTRHILLEALLDPILVIDPQARVVEANPAALKLAGIDGNWQGDALGNWPRMGAPLQKLLSRHNFGNDDPYETHGELLTLKHDDYVYEVRVHDINRTTRDGSVSFGQILYLRDVTQRYLSERKLAQALALSEERLTTISSLHEMLQAQVLRDPLTALYNRRYLSDFFARELARANREQTGIALAVVDLDHFKRLNDTHGHAAGDDALKFIANFFLGKVRNTDAVFRIGGEEFLLILPRVTPAEALEKMQKICNELAASVIPTRNGDLTLTLSAGMAHYPSGAMNLDDLMEKADAELYRAKSLGRNRVSPDSSDTETLPAGTDSERLARDVQIQVPVTGSLSREAIATPEQTMLAGRTDPKTPPQQDR